MIVIHENKGLTPYIKNVTRRLAESGYVAVAPDLLTELGGTESFEDPADATRALAEMSSLEIVDRVRAVISDVCQLSFVSSERLGILGFCFGGGCVGVSLPRTPGSR